jgi:hypothetical protein
MPRKRKRQPAKKESHSLRTYSFLATFTLLIIIIGASYYSSLPKVEHIPDKFNFQAASWMAFVPQTAQYVSYIDYQQAYSASGNSSMFGTVPIFQFYQLHLEIPPQSMLYDLDVQLPQSNSNSVVTVSVVKLRNDTLRILLSAIAKTDLAKSEYDGYPVYNILMISAVSSQQNLISAYMAVTNSCLILSIDPNLGKSGVETMLDQYTTTAPTLFDNYDVRRGVYASGATEEPYIGLFVGTFSSQFNNTRMIVKSVIAQGTGISVTRSVLFPTSDFAMSEFDHAHNVYRDADSYRVLDQWLVISYDYGFDKLRGELTGI